MLSDICRPITYTYLSKIKMTKIDFRFDTYSIKLVSIIIVKLILNVQI